MHRKFIALVVTAAIAAAGLSATPARADNDTARVLAGLTALALIGAAISHRRDGHDHLVGRATVSSSVTGPMPHRPELRRDRPWRPSHRYVLPSQCLRDVPVGRGHSERVLGKRCLNTSYPFARDLPRACEERLWSRARVRNGYDPQCLRSYGYMIARR